ncbi:hypothetical protein [Microbacterium sp. 5K110]|uniref:hypothetical protein n=1 Tax=unclassified Microbacterium TaxID=2609290 RepID=UPI00207BBF71|nr:hypothetical protein [Microbacterium sp. 5K110]
MANAKKPAGVGKACQIYPGQTRFARLSGRDQTALRRTRELEGLQRIYSSHRATSHRRFEYYT